MRVYYSDMSSHFLKFPLMHCVMVTCDSIGGEEGLWGMVAEFLFNLFFFVL